MKKILITGGAGYIGSVIVPELLKTDFQVTVLDNFMYKQNSLLDVCHNTKLNIIVDDVRNETLLKNEVERHDIIIPLAAIVGAPACSKDKSLALSVNQTQAENIANCVNGTVSFKQIKSTIRVTGVNTGYRVDIPVRFVKKA